MTSPVPGRFSIGRKAEYRVGPLFSRTWALIVASTFVSCFALPTTATPAQERSQTPDISVIPKTINDTLDSAQLRNASKNLPAQAKTNEAQDSCLLPPLNFMRGPIVSAAELAVPPKAIKQYQAACAALDEKKSESAEKHLRKAVQIYSKYSAAWVTLGQMLAAQNQISESRGACSQASAVEPNYLPAYLCLADLAAREKAWGEVLQLSGQVLALDPKATALAYEYSAAANLRLNQLDDAEKSALRALEVDKNNRDPRVHFILAQIYEAKGDLAGEISQLHEYLNAAKTSDDIAAVKEYLSRLEKPDSRATSAAISISGSTAKELLNSEGISFSQGEAKWSSKEPDESERYEAPPGCNLNDVLPQIEHRVQEFVDNVQKFTATESLVHESLNGAGQVARANHGTFNYVVSIDEPIVGMLAVNEFQNSRSSSGMPQTDVVTKGLPALLLIFHPYYAGDFSMRCERLMLLKGHPAWQIRFRQRNDKPSRVRSYKMGATGPAFEISLQGRAWFTADDYQIVKLEADLIKAIPEIQLTVDHTSAEYGPVHFQSHGIDIWLPQAADLISERKGKRLHERITFSDYLLFSVDNKQQIAPPRPQEWLSGVRVVPRIIDTADSRE